MGIIRKYRFYKRALQVSMGLSVFFAVCGILALVQFVKVHDVTSLQLAIVGVCTFIFGVIVPILLFTRLAVLGDRIRRQTEENVAKWMAGWLENYRNSEDPMSDPLFWISIALITVETIGETSEHPVLRFVSEMAPMLRSEIKKAAPERAPEPPAPKTKKSRSRQKPAA